MQEVWIIQNEKWYRHDHEPLTGNNQVKLLRDVNIQCNHIVEVRRPNIVAVGKKKNCLIVHKP